MAGRAKDTICITTTHRGSDEVNIIPLSDIESIGTQVE